MVSASEPGFSVVLHPCACCLLVDVVKWVQKGEQDMAMGIAGRGHSTGKDGEG